MPAYKFPRKHRILKRTEFLEIQSRGRKYFCKNFLIILSKNNLNHSRLGVTVSKRVHKRAVVRNRLKRRMREIFRHIHPSLRDHFDILFIARQNADELAFAEIKRQIVGTLRYRKLLAAKEPAPE